MAEYLSPGVYTGEYDNTPRAIEGVETGIAGFVGLAEKGASVGAPALITGYSDFTRKYGGYLSESAYGPYRYLAGSVEQFFTNGGTQCYVARVIPGDAKVAEAKGGLLHVTAANEGSWGNRIVLKAACTVRKENLAELAVEVCCDGETETFTGMSLNPAVPSFVDTVMKKSVLVRVHAVAAESSISSAQETIALSGGSDGTVGQVSAAAFIGEDKGPGKRTGIQAFLENDVVSIMAVPGITIPEVVASLVAHCENTASRFAVIDMPKEMSDLSELSEYRNQIDSSYAAMYHPWIQVFDQASLKPAYFPPSGAVMGVYARTDRDRGVHKAPANEKVNCTGLSIDFKQGEQDILNPRGVNLIRSLPGQGIKIWGARTADSKVAFKYVNIRRLLIYVEESIKANIRWAAAETNADRLWDKIRQSVNSFLDTIWRNGMLAGAGPGESYFVEIGPSTMTAEDIRRGRLICNIGIAPSRPSEFVIFRITQNTAEADAQEKK